MSDKGDSSNGVLREVVMLEIRSLAFRYDPAEDRLCLDVTGETGRSSLMLTRRLGIRWLKALVGWLEAGGDTPQSLEAAHAGALNRLARDASGSAPDASRDADTEREAAVRLSRIEFVQRKLSMKVIFYAEKDVPVAAGTFGRQVVHGLVARLVRKMGQAGWGDTLPIPQWCRVASEDRQALRRKWMLH